MATLAGHEHVRATAAARSRPVLLATLALTCAFLVVELVAGLWTGSLALLADAGHMLTDAGALALALFATWIAARPPTPAKTYGYYRAEILAALVNALVLLVVAGAILVEAWRRWHTPSPVLAGPMAVVAAAHHDAVASAAGVELFASPLLTAPEISAARAELLRNGLLRTASGGWQLTSRAHRLSAIGYRSTNDAPSVRRPTSDLRRLIADSR